MSMFFDFFDITPLVCRLNRHVRGVMSNIFNFIDISKNSRYDFAIDRHIRL